MSTRCCPMLCGLASALALSLLSARPASAAATGPVPEARAPAPHAGDAPPRKVVVGTTMYAMWGDHPGLAARLAALAGLIDQMAAEAARKYQGAGLDLAVLPENAVTGGLTGAAAQRTVPLEGEVLDAMARVARKHNTYIVLPMGLAEDPERGIYTNAAVLLDRTGAPVGTYRKVHAVADANNETLEGGLTPGADFPVFDCDFGRIAIQICYDMAYDDGWEALGRKGAEIVAWPSQSPQTIEPRARARRHGYYVVSSTWRNNASIFDPIGDLIGQTTQPSSVLVEQIDLSYALVDWQPKLRNGEAFVERYGDAVGFRYSEADDGGIFWSNDPSTPIMRMVRELGLELSADSLARALALQDRVRGGPPSTD